jgi:putative serine protease PepD
MARIASGRGAGTTGALALVLALATAACSSKTATAPTTVAGAGTLQDTFVSVVGSVRPTVVEIVTTEGLGSGVIYDTQGNIVTNAHVVGSATGFKVTLLDGRTLDATLVGVYPPDDLAVVKVSAGTLPAATFADSTQVKVGVIVLAIGNPLGLASSVTDGIVSSTGRTVGEGSDVVLPSTIQTSAPINPGNSGGGLVDLNGHVIGIPTLAATDPQLGAGAAPGIGFAIPSNTVKQIAAQLISTGTVTNSGRAGLGATGTAVASLSGQPVGVLLRSVQPGSGAATAGIKVGDVVTTVNGTSTPTFDDLLAVLAPLAPGQTATVNVIHADATTQSYTVTLGVL